MSEDTEATAQEEHSFIMEDLDKAQKRVAKAKFIEAQKEFADNAYPLMQEAFEHFGQRLVRLEQVMDTLIDGTDSLIQPELADQIMATLDLGKVIVEAVAVLKVGEALDETTVKRLQGQCAAYLTAYELTAEAVEEHTGSDEEDEELEAGGEDAGETAEGEEE